MEASDSPGEAATAEASPARAKDPIEQWHLEVAERESMGNSVEWVFGSAEDGYGGSWKATVTKDGALQGKTFTCKLNTFTKEKYDDADGPKVLGKTWRRASMTDKKNCALRYLDANVQNAPEPL